MKNASLCFLIGLKGAKPLEQDYKSQVKKRNMHPLQAESQTNPEHYR